MTAAKVTVTDERNVETLHRGYLDDQAVAVRVSGRRKPAGPSISDAGARRLVDLGLARRSRPAGRFALLTDAGRDLAAELDRDVV